MVAAVDEELAKHMPELAVVRLTTSLPGLPAGSTGTVVHLHGDGTQACEVEFSDENGRTVAVETINIVDLHVVWSPETQPK